MFVGAFLIHLILSYNSVEFQINCYECAWLSHICLTQITRQLYSRPIPVRDKIGEGGVGDRESTVGDGGRGDRGGEGHRVDR